MRQWKIPSVQPSAEMVENRGGGTMTAQKKPILTSEIADFFFHLCICFRQGFNLREQFDAFDSTLIWAGLLGNFFVFVHEYEPKNRMRGIFCLKWKNEESVTECQDIIIITKK